MDLSRPFEVRERDVPYLQTPEGELLLRLYEPVGAPGPLPAVVDVHGGAWSSGDRTSGAIYKHAAASCGVVVASVEFRDGRLARHPSGSADVLAAVRWVRVCAGGLDIDPARIALMGSSSGGHVALYAALNADSLDLEGVELITPAGRQPASGGNVSVAFVAAFWPPADPLARYLYAKSSIGKTVPEGQRFAPEALVQGGEVYFGTEEVMAEASISNVVASRSGGLPSAWVARAGADLNVPSSILDELVRAYRSAGGAIEMTDYPGQVHAFGQVASPATGQFVSDLCARLQAAFEG